ncbi:MAG TPA: nucleotidyltransferase domain-containing protein [Victivallales bacterium]|nr:nucleotidyltransferase domain-containing protein [Victivallales bacterium]
MVTINYPNDYFKNYIEYISNICHKKKLSLILKGSLANGSAKKHSDIDLIILGSTRSNDIDQIISEYSIPVMTNFTERPKGSLILIYRNNLSIDLDIKQTITADELNDSVILQKFDNNFILAKEIIRMKVESFYLPNRPQWYKILRLIHKSLLKQLCNKTENALDLLQEIKSSLKSIGINNLKYKNDFQQDIIHIFKEICNKYTVEPDIKILYKNLFNEL